MTTHYPDNDTVDVASPLQRERVYASSAHSGNRAVSQPDNDRILVDSEDVATCRTKDFTQSQRVLCTCSPKGHTDALTLPPTST